MEGSVTWGTSFRERPALQWTPFGSTYGLDDGMKELKEDLISKCKVKIKDLRYGRSIGKVVEKLDHETVKIKLNKPGLLKKKMKLSIMRSYHWAKGGVEIRIEDYEQFVDYLSNTEGEIIWNFYNSDSLDPGYVDFDEIEWEDYKSRNTKDFEVIINDLRQKLKNNYFICSLNGKTLYRVIFNEDLEKIISMEPIYIGERIRDIEYDQLNNVFLLILENTPSLGILSH